MTLGVVKREEMLKSGDPQALHGKRVELLCFAPFAVYIHVESRILLTVEAAFEHVHGETRERELITLPASRSGLMRLLSCVVISADSGSDGSLHLVFSNGDSLHIPKQTEFESYQLRVGDDEMIV